MHDRRVDGETLKFGNQGALFMNAMTWWDLTTFSIWSQPWGSAISGELEGTALTLIPASLTTWGTWFADHPETTVLGNDMSIGVFRPYSPTDEFVIGVALEESATAYHYFDAAERRVINDRVGDHELAVFVNPDTRDIKVYLRRPGAEISSDLASSELTFGMDDDGRIVDAETGSVWDITRGVAIDGPLRGTGLQQIPYVTSFDWAWEDFFPHTTFYKD